MRKASAPTSANLWKSSPAAASNAACSAAASAASFAVVLAASGWLYVIQPHSHVPGPAIADALPLDELSRRSGVPLLVFVAVWATAALLLGLIARAARAERLTAGLMLGLGIGGWAYLETGLSLFIVRQVPADQAFHAAATQKAVYLPALLAGLAGALCGRARASERPRSPLVLSWFVAAAGLLLLLAGAQLVEQARQEVEQIREGTKRQKSPSRQSGSTLRWPQNS